MDEQDFELLDTLAETRNITRAADRLYTTQSSVSKRIRQMERDLGAILILRSRQGVHFTPAGEKVLAHARRMLSGMEAMRQDLLEDEGHIAGTLRAGVSMNYARYRLQKPLIAYRRAYPLVTTRIRTGNSQKISADFLANRIDVAVLRGEYQWQGERILLGRERLCLIVSEAFGDTPISELPQVVHYETDMEWQIAQWMRENRIQPNRNIITVNNTATCMELVKNGLGWGIVPEICLGDFRGRVEPLSFASGEPLLRSTYIIHSPQIDELPQVSAFIDMVKKFWKEDSHA